MKILVVGGAGYIGSHVVADLCKKGHDVFVFDNLYSGSVKNIDKKANFIKGDINSENDLEKLFKIKFDIVFHFAALKAAGESMENPGIYSKNNINGTINLLNAMVSHNVKKIIFSSSAAVYGYPEYLPIDEKHPIKPINYYGYTKKVIEEILSWYGKLKGIKYVALRYFNAAGYDINGRITEREKTTANLLPIVLEYAIGLRDRIDIFGDDYDTPDGTGIRDYIHVNDLSIAHLKAMEYLNDNNSNLVLNLGTGYGYSVLEVVKMVEEITGKDIKYSIVGRREGDPAKLIAVSNLAKKTINWKAKYSDLGTILSSMWELYSKIRV
ncbi:MAG: UDP-glucose 4-epimerase GalE [Candidatus Marinimicrobia bacterium]|jgi:UDP-glucose 4-epimerase|nr:UDP-glucose 4-epimerase GalE [Candidatus Neomarinimicrobiota bacterium]